MKKRRKHKSYLNYGELLNQNHNSCPNCGQENTDHQVSGKYWIVDAAIHLNFFSPDSRFAHMLKPFLFSSGKIPMLLLKGKGCTAPISHKL